MKLKVGDSAAVKSGVSDPDFGSDISGWQGRVEELVDEELILIRWDGITLREMGSALIIRCENENFEWKVMYLYEKDVDVVTPRDSKADVRRAASRLEKQIRNDPRFILD